MMSKWLWLIGCFYSLLSASQVWSPLSLKEQAALTICRQWFNSLHPHKAKSRENYVRSLPEELATYVHTVLRIHFLKEYLPSLHFPSTQQESDCVQLLLELVLEKHISIKHTFMHKFCFTRPLGRVISYYFHCYKDIHAALCNVSFAECYQWPHLIKLYKIKHHVNIHPAQRNRKHFYNGNIGPLIKEIATLKQLTQLVITNTVLTFLPSEVGTLSNLKELCLDNNYLQSLPESIRNLHNLTYIGLYKNRFTFIPKVVQKLNKKSIVRRISVDIRRNPINYGNHEFQYWFNQLKNRNIIIAYRIAGESI